MPDTDPNRLPHKALLPNGFHDVLPPEAAREADVVARLMAELAAHDYQRVKPPLVEFEDTLLSGAGQAMAPRSFRMMDPVSQRMLAVRSDMTLQVARIATHRLAGMARPLRLSYSGQVLAVTGSQLRPERQFTQVGAELIGAPQAAADAELLALAVELLQGVGVAGITLDLNQPTLVPALFASAGLDGADAAALRAALDRKDAERVEALGGPIAGTLRALLEGSGPADRALERAKGLALPDGAAAALGTLATVVGALAQALSDVNLTVDLVEHRGFEYDTGVSFSLFARGVRGELGRGGRYQTDGGEPATGFTLFMDSVLRGVPAARPPRRLYLPFGTDRARARALRAEGWTTVPALDEAPAGEAAAADARRLGCTHVWQGDKAEKID